MKIISTEYLGNEAKTVTADAQPGNQGSPTTVVNVYPAYKYQTFLGFGGAITEASAATWSSMPDALRAALIELYFGAGGNRYEFVRGSIDSCDFSESNYCSVSDVEGETFSKLDLHRDDATIIPMMTAAQQQKGSPLELMLSPWSPPAFMKTNNDRNHGGKLRPEYYGVWAEYVCSYIMAYAAHGLKVRYITVQNEPEAVQTWDSCIYTAADEKALVRDYLYPALVRNGLGDIKINIWDHNKEVLIDRAQGTIDADTDTCISGIAFHWYTGDHFEAVALAREIFPGKDLIFTEGCVEYSRFSADELKAAQMYAHDIIGNLNAGMNASIDWNILLNEQGGPNHVANYCDAPVMYDRHTQKMKIKLSYHYIGHFSRHIDKYARRVATTKYTDRIEVTSFENPDGSIVTVLLNRTEAPIPITLRINGADTAFDVPASAIVTCVES